MFVKGAVGRNLYIYILYCLLYCDICKRIYEITGEKITNTWLSLN